VITVPERKGRTDRQTGDAQWHDHALRTKVKTVGSLLTKQKQNCSFNTLIQHLY